MPDSYIDRSYNSGFGSPSVRKTILRMYRERASKDFKGWEDKLLAVLGQKPALVLWGDRDSFISPTYADRYHGAQVHHFEKYSHWLPLEVPVLFGDFGTRCINRELRHWQVIEDIVTAQMFLCVVSTNEPMAHTFNQV